MLGSQQAKLILKTKDAQAFCLEAIFGCKQNGGRCIIEHDLSMQLFVKAIHCMAGSRNDVYIFMVLDFNVEEMKVFKLPYQ